MEYRNRATGLIYKVTNPNLLASYEASEAFEKVEKVETKPAEKKATTKKK